MVKLPPDVEGFLLWRLRVLPPEKRTAVSLLHETTVENLRYDDTPLEFRQALIWFRHRSQVQRWGIALHVTALFRKREEKPDA